MDWLNHGHLLYFWTVATEGSIARASEVLHLTPQTISAQLKTFEEAVGQPLFERRGRNLVLTETGELVRRYADDIFGLSRELSDSLKGRSTGKTLQLRVGLADALPKLVAYRILEPALHLEEPVQLVCREEGMESLLSQLAVHRLDVVLNDSPLPPHLHVRAYNHLLGQCGILWMAAPGLAERAARNFPHTLNDLPLLLPTADTALRRALDAWCERSGVTRRRIVAEIVDSALLKAFGEAGDGVFPVADVIADTVAKHYGVVPVGRADGVTESYYAITVERRIRHPAVVAICERARRSLFE
ncbi:MAG: transcriptional activator NhaR [Myxococcota bacterium]